jgi:glutamine synthetase
MWDQGQAMKDWPQEVLAPMRRPWRPPSPSPEAATRIEYRSPDPACNPYLAFAAMLGAGQAAVEGEYELPLEASHNIFEMTEEDWGRRASGRFRRTSTNPSGSPRVPDVLREGFGKHVHGYLIRNTREEWDAFIGPRHPLRAARYLPIL